MNIKEVAVLAETSVATVSRVLNEDTHVSQSTRQRVLEIIEVTGYKPNLIGRNLRTLHSEKILVMMPTTSNPYYSRVMQGIEHRASLSGYDTLFVITHRVPENERRYLDLVLTKQVDGIIVLASTLDGQEMNQIAGEYPFVQCGAYTIGDNISYACIDNVRAAYEAVSYLIKTGNRRVGIINGPYSRTYEVEREAGYKQALAEAGIPLRDDYIRSCEYSHIDAYECCSELMGLNDPPTAIFTSSDQMAAGVVRYLMKHQLIAGRDVDVFGFDNSFISDMFYPAISSVSQPGYELGKVAFDLLLEKINDIHSISKGIVLNYKLELRDTTKPLPEK